MNEEIMNNVTEETANQETIPAETDEVTVGSLLVSGAVLVGTFFATGFATFAGAAIANNLFLDKEAKLKREIRKEARKAKRAEKKARKAKKPVIVDEEITIEADTVEE